MASHRAVEDLHNVAIALGTTALSCPVGAQRAPPSGSQEAQNSGRTLVHIIHTIEWLKHQIQEHKVALAAAKKSRPEVRDPEKIQNENIELEKELLECSSERNLQELILKRLQISQSLCEWIFPSAQESPTEDTRVVREMLSKQADLSSEILGLQKNIDQIKKDIDATMRQSRDEMKSNRELLNEIKGNRDQQQELTPEGTHRLQEAKDDLEGAVSKAVLGQHIFQGLILGSGINWAQDKDMTKLVLTLGEPIDSHLKPSNVTSSMNPS